jgi:hypothetical protein
MRLKAVDRMPISSSVFVFARAVRSPAEIFSATLASEINGEARNFEAKKPEPMLKKTNPMEIKIFVLFCSAIGSKYIFADWRTIATHGCVSRN